MVYIPIADLRKLYRTLVKRLQRRQDVVRLAIFPSARNVDAALATRILLSLFPDVRCAVFPVSTVHDIARFNVPEHKCSFDTFVFINCTGEGDLANILEFVSDRVTPDEDAREMRDMCIIFDSHRPLHLRNLFAYSNVIVPYNGDPRSDLAEERMAFETLHARRDKVSPESILAAQETVQTYFTTPQGHDLSSALVMYYMARSIGRDTLPLLWLAIVGFTYQYVFGHIPPDRYYSRCREMQAEVLRFPNSAGPRTKGAVIEHVDDFVFPLWRHWSLYEAMYHSIQVASDMRLWRAHRDHVLDAVFARPGISLTNARGPVTQIKPDDLRRLHNDETFQTYHIPSFMNHIYNMTAFDMCYALQAVLDGSPDEGYSTSIARAVHVGIGSAKAQLDLLVSSATFFLNNRNQIRHRRTFLYANLNALTHAAKGDLFSPYLDNPLLTLRLATAMRNILAKGLPMVLSLTLPPAEHDHHHGTVGGTSSPPAVWVVCDYDAALYRFNVLYRTANAVGALHQSGEETKIILLDDDRDLEAYLEQLRETLELRKREDDANMLEGFVDRDDDDHDDDDDDHNAHEETVIRDTGGDPMEV